MKSGLYMVDSQQMCEMMMVVLHGDDDNGDDHNPDNDGGARGEAGRVINHPLPFQRVFSNL